MPRSKASIEAQSRYDAKAYDRVLTRFPKGTKDRITALGETVNGFTVRAVLARLEALEAAQGVQQDEAQPHDD